MIKRILLSLAIFLSALHVAAQDTCRVSVITCSPGEEVYALYGHTAIRCRVKEGDIVFNYGAFDFYQPNFAWHFVLGKCDYMVEAVPWPVFAHEYERLGRSVTEHVLNLTPVEAERLTKALVVNSLPENCEYRYNFLTNNCTTKVRDMIEAAVDGEIEYNSLEEYTENQGLTHRQMLHRFNCVDPWVMEGCDVLLAADVDTLLDERSSMCLPDYFMRYVEHAVIRSSDTIPDNVRPLVSSHEVIIPARPMATEDGGLSPFVVMSIVLGFFVLLVVVEQLLHRQLWFVDVLLLLFQGLLGVMLLFLMLVSEHPGVHHNWLILLFHPFAFVGIYFVVRAALKKQPTRWHAFNFAILVAFLVFSPWMPQHFGKIIVPLALILLTRPTSYLFSYKVKLRNRKPSRAKKLTD